MFRKVKTINYPSLTRLKISVTLSWYTYTIFNAPVTVKDSLLPFLSRKRPSMTIPWLVYTVYNLCFGMQNYTFSNLDMPRPP